MKISVLIITKNEEKLIKEAIKSTSWVDEVIVVDNSSTDKTAKISKDLGAKVYVSKFNDYSMQRNFALKKAKGKWVLYLDADERITNSLKKEIREIVAQRNNQVVAYDIPRENIRYGKIMKHGGWWPDYVTRLFKKDNLQSWYGKVHESPVFEGKKGHLKNPLIHYGRSLEKNLEKTINWSKIEAQLLLEANHPKVTWWRVLRIGASEFLKRFIYFRGFLDGIEGLIEAFYQSFSRMITYTRLWEIQQKHRNTSEVACGQRRDSLDDEVNII